MNLGTYTDEKLEQRRQGLRPCAAWRKSEYFIGVDLGQAQDPTAIVILERREVALGTDPVTWAQVMDTRYLVRFLERLPLQTSYTGVVERVAKVAREVRQLGECLIVADATGVGRPVIDMLRDEQLPCLLEAVVITGGERQHQVDGYWHVPKRDLIQGLQVMVQDGTFEVVSKLDEAQILAKEMLNLRVTPSRSGTPGYQPWRDGEHDDLVLAAALACWRGRSRPLPPTNGTRPLLCF